MVTKKMKFTRKGIASAGDIIEFTEKGKTYQAIVINAYVNSATIQLLNKADALELGIEDDKTVVTHASYKVLEKAN